MCPAGLAESAALGRIGALDDVIAGGIAALERASVVVAGIARRDHAGEHLSWGIVSDLDLMGALRSGSPGGDRAAGGG